MTNNDREPLISKDENTVNAVTEVTEEDLRSAVQKISSLATVVRPSSLLQILLHDLRGGSGEHGYCSVTHHVFSHVGL